MNLKYYYSKSIFLIRNHQFYLNRMTSVNDFQFRMTKMTLIYFKVNDFYSIILVQEIYIQWRTSVKLKDFVNINLLLLLLLSHKSLQSCPTLCDPIDGSPQGSPVPGILQARTLEWVSISFSNAWKWKVKVKSLSCVGLLATPWTAAYQAPPSMGFSKQEYWSGLPLPSPFE